MRAYFINLDRRPDRCAVMEVRLDALGIPHTRISAKTPADVTDIQRRRFCNPLAYRWQTEAELSCGLSHQAALKTFLATPDAYALIFEDDVLLSPSLPRFLEDFEQHPPELDLLRIETDNSRPRLAPQPSAKFGSFALHRLYVSGGGSAAYIVSRRAAQRIVAGDEILADLTDQALFNPFGPLGRALVIRQLSPALAVQEDRTVPPDSAERLAMSDLEVIRRDRGKRDLQNFWRRSAFNFYDLVDRDIVGAVRKQWNKHRHGVVKRELPFKAD